MSASKITTRVSPAGRHAALENGQVFTILSPKPNCFFAAERIGIYLITVEMPFRICLEPLNRLLGHLMPGTADSAVFYDCKLSFFRTFENTWRKRSPQVLEPVRLMHGAARYFSLQMTISARRGA